MSVIYPGIDLAEYERPGRPGSIPGVLPENKVIMYVGSIVHPNQGVPILIEALPQIFESRPDARCVLVGGPAEAGERYRAQLGRHGERLIVLTGQTPDQVIALCAAPMSWSIPDSPVVRTIPSRARSPSISPPAARSWRPTSAIINTSWAAPAQGL